MTVGAGIIDVGGERITNLGEPTRPDHAATKGYVDSGGAQHWVMLFDSEDLANLDGTTTSGGTWELNAGVVQQTDDTGDDGLEKTLEFDWTTALTPSTVFGLSALAVIASVRCDTENAITVANEVKVNGGTTTAGELSLTSSNGDGSFLSVYEDDSNAPVAVGVWSEQALAGPVNAAAGFVADETVITDGELPKAQTYDLYADSSPALTNSNGTLTAGQPLVLLTKNTAGSFRFRLLGLYLPTLPA